MLGAGKEGGRATGNSNEVEAEIKRGRTRGPSGVGGWGVKTETHRQSRGQRMERKGAEGERISKGCLQGQRARPPPQGAELAGG